MPGSGTLRPQSAPVAARSIYVGATAKPAGLAGFMGAGFVTAYDRRPTLREQHALRMASMYAEVTGPGYKAREAAVHPSWHNVGAGVISAGSVDNTYLPSPLQNSWGKNWGEDGFGRVARGKNMCSISNLASYPVIKDEEQWTFDV